jgi:hypothetical protein
MGKKPDETVVIQQHRITITICFLSVFFPLTAAAADARLIEANKNLQSIFKQIKQKYAEHDAQQASLAMQTQAAEIAAGSTDTRHNSDGTIADTTTDSFLDASTSTTNDSRFAPGEELILEASTNGIPLASLFAVKTEQGFRIGLNDFFQIAEFPIVVDVAKASADGWFLSEKNQFTLRRLSDGRLEVKVNGKTHHVDADSYEAQDDLLVEMTDIARWFDLTYKLNEESLLLAISSPAKFPAELRLARSDNKNITSTAASKSVLPLKESGYKAFSPPMFDVQTWAQQFEQVIPASPSSQNPGETTTYKDSSANYSILASHDLAYLNTELFLAGDDDDSLKSARLTMSRQSDSADLLGPLRATEYAFGDVTPVNAGFGSTQGLTRGLSLGNTPLDQLADNRKVNITGEIQTGWDIELYRNGVLIDQRLGSSEGRYEFNDIQLDYGNNDFELIFYGPQGQRETKTESYIVEGNTVLAGQGMYRFSLVEVGKSLLNVDHFDEDPTQQGTMASTVLDYGLTDWLAVSAGSSVFEPKLGDTQQFFTLGTSASMGKAGLFSARILQNNDQRQSTDFNYRTRFWDTSYALNYRQSESVDPLTDAETKTNTYAATMSGQLFTGGWLPIAYQNAWQRNENKEQNLRDEYYQNAIGIGSRLGYFSNSLTLQKDIIAPPSLPLSLEPTMQDRLTGSFQYRKSFGRLHTRLFNNYAIQPTNETFAYGGTFNYSWTQNFNSELRYTYYKLQDQYQVDLGLNWNKDAFYLSTNAGYNEDGSWTAGLGLRFSLGYEPLQRSVFTSAQPIAQSGAVSARVFEDLNMNGIFDANEPPIENATVKAVQAYRQEKTNKSGVAVLSSIYNNTTTDIVVDESTLDGPFMITAIPGVAIKARKGYVETVDLPVVKAGEVEGVIYLKNTAGASDVAPYITLNLVDKNEKIIATTRSEYDGYYLFTNVKPGSYSLKVDENYIDRRGLKTANKNLDFSSDGDVIAGVDFVLRPLDKASGYVASAGHFDNPALLKLYYHILRNKLGGQFAQTPFYIKKPDKGGYILGLAYYPGRPAKDAEAQRKAQQACNNLAKSKVHCDVQYHDFKY